MYLLSIQDKCSCLQRFPGRLHLSFRATAGKGISVFFYVGEISRCGRSSKWQVSSLLAPDEIAPQLFSRAVDATHRSWYNGHVQQCTILVRPVSQFCARSLPHVAVEFCKAAPCLWRAILAPRLEGFLV